MTASRHDGAVSFKHAEGFIRAILNSELVETDAKSHFYWLGTERNIVSDAVQDFLAK